MNIQSNQEAFSLSWRDERYISFNSVVDQLVCELQAHHWHTTGKKKRVAGEKLNKLTYSVSRLVAESVGPIVDPRKIPEASVHLGKGRYGKGGTDPMLTYDMHIARAYRGLIELGYLRQTRDGYYDRSGGRNGKTSSRVTRFAATIEYTHQSECTGRTPQCVWVG